jgi:hypothetical protein
VTDECIDQSQPGIHRRPTAALLCSGSAYTHGQKWMNDATTATISAVIVYRRKLQRQRQQHRH